MTPEERQSIVDEAVEKAILLIPKVVGNLITENVGMLRINRDFYSKFKEFAQSKDIVASVVEEIEGTHPELDYESILKQAVPIIRERIKTVKNLNRADVEKPNTNISQSSIFDKLDQGEL